MRQCIAVFSSLCVVQKLAQVGVISGMDMTVEAALTKLSYLLAGKLTTEQIKEEMKKNLRGELTLLDSRCHQPYLKNSKFLSDVASALNISSSKVSIMVVGKWRLSWII